MADAPEANKRDVKGTGKLVLLVVLGILVLLFMGLNTDETTVDLLLFELTSPLFVVIIGTTVVGVIIGFLVAKILDRR